MCASLWSTDVDARVIDPKFIQPHGKVEARRSGHKAHLCAPHSGQLRLMLVSLCSTCEVTSFATQRRLMENADERLRQPDQGGRFETGCVVCARRFWREQLKMLILFQDPAGNFELGESGHNSAWTTGAPVSNFRGGKIQSTLAPHSGDGIARFCCGASVVQGRAPAFAQAKDAAWYAWTERGL